MSPFDRARIIARLVVCLLAAVIAGGCASQGRASDRSLSDYITKIRQLQTAARPAPATASATLEQNDPDLAAARLLLTIAPTAAHHRGVGEAYARLGVRDTAFDHFRAAVRLDRTDAASYDQLARIWRDWGFPQVGLSDAHRSIYYAPGSAVAQNTLGTILLKMRQPAAARTAFEKARALDPTAGYIVSNLCYVNLVEGRTTQALEMCKTAVDLQPALKAARNNLALAYAALGDFPRARREFSKAGDSANAAFNMGMAYAMTRNFDEAAVEFLAAWRAKPDFALAGVRLKQVEAMRDR